MLNKKLIIVSCGIALFGFGCQPMVLKQNIPVSTNPLGAKIYANGTLVGQTPATVSLERTQNHIITLVKENYRQEDVVISK
ncbi:MAG: PEGA domain-containing protein [Geobacter sp.]|nr:MAG: PEGA domain-containing protein [Geobacter sp.]